jgi:hypothetical protein
VQPAQHGSPLREDDGIWGDDDAVPPPKFTFPLQGFNSANTLAPAK